MSQGKTAHTSTHEVCSVIDSLEVSPSHRGGTSPIAHSGSKAHAGSESTGKFASAGKTTRPKPRGTKTGFGKKNMMAQKSRGR